MRMGRVVLVATIACLALTSCTAAPPSDEESPLDAAGKDKMFVALWRGAAENDLPGTDEVLVDAGHKWCTALESGSTSEELVEAMVERGSSRNDIELLDSLAIKIFCPDQG